MISKSFFKSSFIYTVTGALPLASSILLLPFYIAYLGTADFGLLTLYISFTLLLQILFNFSFDSALTYFYFDYREDAEKLHKYISSVVIFLLIIGVCCTIFLITCGQWVFSHLFRLPDAQFYTFGSMCIITAFFNSFFKTFTNLLIAQQKPERYMWANLLNFALTIGISLIGIYMTHSLLGPMLGRLLSGVGIFILALYWFLKNYGWHWNWQLLKPTIGFNKNIYLQGILMWIITYCDRYIINYYLNVTTVGVYDLSVRCTSFIEFSMTGINNSIVPKVLGIWKNSEAKSTTPETNRYYNVYTAIVILMIAATIVFIPYIVSIVIKKNIYYRSFEILPLLCGAMLIKIFTFQSTLVLLQNKKSNISLRIQFLLAVVKISGGILLMKWYGIYGLISAIYICNIFESLLYYFAAAKLYTIKINTIKLILLPIAVVIFIWSCQFIYVNNYHSFIFRIAYGLTLTFPVLWIYRKELKNAFCKINFTKQIL